MSTHNQLVAECARLQQQIAALTEASLRVCPWLRKADLDGAFKSCSAPLGGKHALIHLELVLQEIREENEAAQVEEREP